MIPVFRIDFRQTKVVNVDWYVFSPDIVSHSGMNVRAMGYGRTATVYVKEWKANHAGKSPA